MQFPVDSEGFRQEWQTDSNCSKSRDMIGVLRRANRMILMRVIF